MKFPLAAALASDVEFLERWLAAGNDIDEPLEPEAADVARRPEVTGQLLAMLNAGGGAKLDPESLLFTHRKLSATLGIAFDESTARAALSDCDARSDGRIAVQQYSSLFSARVQDASPSLSWTALHLCAGRGNLDAVRTLLELVAGHTLAPEEPVLGGVVQASRNARGKWSTGRMGSDASATEIGIGIPMEES